MLIIELAGVLAGPLTGTFFAELGAEVIKIENVKTGGDVTRHWKLGNEDQDAPVSAYYASANYGKKVLMLDLRNHDDYQRLMDLIVKADILLVNFKPGDAEKLGLDYDSIKKKNPEIIYGAINGFGEDNPRAAFDVVLQAESGFMHINGEPNSKPLKMPVALIDILAAHHLKEGLLYALWQKEKTGKGSKVVVSLYDAALSSLANQATNWLMNKQEPEAIGSLHPNIAPYGDMFQTNDGRWLIFAVGSDAQFRKLCSGIHLPELADNSAFISNQQRVQNRPALQAILEKEIAKQPISYWEERFNELQVPFGVVRNFPEVFSQPEAQSLLINEVQEGVDTTRVKSVVFKISKNSSIPIFVDNK
jgi:crotonobetainyl-CoA:carnitine CoA-transferase CaiB-like acyl-CoA transferase